MRLELTNVAMAMGAEYSGVDGVVSGWSVDSRSVAPGDLFFALRGPTHDGHQYVAAALDRGAVAAVVELSYPNGGRVLKVPSTLAGLQSLARAARRQWGGTVIGVTGSAGKTSTKDVIAHLLNAGKTVGNFNNHIGVPLSLLRLPDDCRIAVIEMGMNHAGEIRQLARIAEPEIGVVTNVGYAHVEFFDSIEGIAAAKRELIEELPRDGTAILNADDPLVARFRDAHPGPAITFGFSRHADVRAEAVEGSRFRVGAVEFETFLPGRHAILNVLAGIASARVFGIAPADLRDAVRTLAVGKMRGERIEQNGITVLNDSYNSNPEALRSMVDLLASSPARRRIAVLGEMLELGRSSEKLHRDAGSFVAERNIDALIGIRGAARFMVDEAVKAGLSGGAAYFFEDSDNAGIFLREYVREGDLVLFKGSRGVQVERAMNRMLEGRS